jgi:hypothetical protein
MQIKTILTMGLVTAAMAFLTGPAYAATSVAADVNGAVVYNSNKGFVNNFTSTNANSGFNLTSGKKAGLTTGDATANGGVVNGVNSSNTKGKLTDNGSGASANNSKGGVAVAADVNFIVAYNENFGAVGNFVTTNANTGWNLTTGGKSVNTGDAKSSAMVFNSVNTNKADITVADNASGATADNSGWKKSHGDDVAVAADVNAAGVVNLNNGFVTNFVATNSNTGGNITSGTEDKKGKRDYKDPSSTAVETGDATAFAMVSSSVNHNDSTVTVTDNGTGASAMNTGKKGDGVAVGIDANLAGVVNVNNGSVVNMVGTNANTGANVTTGGSVTTGDATSKSFVASNVNDNKSNVTVTGSGDTSAQNGSSDHHEGMSAASDTGSTGTTATNTGSGVAVAADVNAGVVVNSNQGCVTSNVQTNSNTGGNVTGSTDPTPSHSDNGGSSQSSTTTTTGNANASSTVVNTVNTNTTSITIGN